MRFRLAFRVLGSAAILLALVLIWHSTTRVAHTAARPALGRSVASAAGEPVQASASQVDAVRAEEVESLRSEIAVLRTALADLANRQRGLSDEVGELVAGVPRAAELPSVSDEPPRLLEEADLRERARLALLDFEDRFSTEVPDSSGSLWVREEVEHELEAASLGGTRLAASECSATSCRLEFVFDDEGTLHETVGNLPFLLPTP
jgi:hypothetical protein